MIVEFGGKFVKTSPLPVDLWAWSVLFGFLSLPLALLLKLLLPIHEAPSTFFGYGAWRATCLMDRRHRHRRRSIATHLTKNHKPINAPHKQRCPRRASPCPPNSRTWSAATATAWPAWTTITCRGQGT